ncbi:MAG: thermonuclease family protein [Thermus sp.]
MKTLKEALTAYRRRGVKHFLPLLLALGQASVVDGDTLETHGVRVRLWRIDAVESSQTCLDASGRPWPCGRRAAFALADFIGKSPVSCLPKDRDRYGRVVAVCSVRGVELNRWLVAERLRYYHESRLHSGLGYRTPREVMEEALGKTLEASHGRQGESV